METREAEGGRKMSEQKQWTAQGQHIIGPDGERIATIDRNNKTVATAHAIREFMLAALNSHIALVEAVEALLTCDLGDNGSQSAAAIEDMARAALALAVGK